MNGPLDGTNAKFYVLSLLSGGKGQNKFSFSLSVNVPLMLPYKRASTAEGIIKVKGKKPITSGFTCNFSMLINYGCFVNSWSLSIAAINITGSNVARTNSLLSVSNILVFLWFVD